MYNADDFIYFLFQISFIYKLTKPSEGQRSPVMYRHNGTWIRYLYKTGQCPYHEHVFEAVF